LPTVNGVRKERSGSGTHDHVAGVCTVDGTYVSRAGVFEALARGEDWHIELKGEMSPIRKIEQCPYPGCRFGPYLGAKDELLLEMLPLC
jgi:hypothetical protein